MAQKTTTKKTFFQQLKRIFKNMYFRNILLAVIVFFAIVFSSKFLLDVFTRHGESAPVPDFKGLTVDEAISLAKQNNLRIEIADSIFLANQPAGSVLEQQPHAETQVKKNRMIYLTINGVAPRKVKVPNVVGYSLRQAKAVLSAEGIKVGKLVYADDMAMNNVIGQKSKDVETNKIITHESNREPIVFLGDEIELVVGLGTNPSERYTYVPNVLGRSKDEAKSLLIESYLNVGTINYDNTIKTDEEKRNAVVASQNPSGNSKNSLGQSINLTLTKRK